MARQSRLTIPSRIVLGFVVVLLAFGSVAILSLVQHSRTGRTLQLLEEGYLPLALTLGEAKATQELYTTLLERAAENPEAGSARTWLRAALRIRPTTLRRAYEGLDRAESLAVEIGDPTPLHSVREMLDKIGVAYEEGEARYEAFFGALEAGNTEETEALFQTLRNEEQRIQRYYRRGWKETQEQISLTSAEAAAQEKSATVLFGLLGLLALIVGIAVTLWSQSVLRPLPLLHKRVQAVARGDLSSEVEVKRDDELGQLVVEFERMVEALAARDASLREAALAEQRLQKMQVQIVAGLRAAVVVVAPDLTVRSVNPAAERVLGLGPRDVGKKISQSPLYRRLETLEAAVEQVATGGEPVWIRGERMTGFTERLVDVLVTPFGGGHDEPGDRRAVLVVTDDVTEQAATKTRLIHTERLASIGRMAAHVTHEVRNPLSSIGLNVDMLVDEIGEPTEEARNLVRSIQQELDRLENITEEYLRLARLPEPQLSSEDPTDLLNSAAEFVRREMDAAKVELRVAIDENLPPVAVDEPQLRQALLNLLRNAREAMPEGGIARLEATRYDGGVRIQVHDAGAGIDAEDRDRVFDLFYTTKERGTGLGLPLTQQIVVAHGGTIACKARHPHGTTFEIWLPATVEAGRGSAVRRAG